jgi:predicted TIM-barrel fold metal-dependent hydrolase
MQNVKLAAEELERMAKHKCMRAVFIAEHINGRNLHEKEFWPIYERSEALGLPLSHQSLSFRRRAQRISS